MHNINDKEDKEREEETREREEEIRERKRNLGIALKQARKAAGVKTQDDLSKKAVIPLETIRSWEQGRKAPQLPQLLKLCEIYNCDLDYLVGRIKCKTHEIQDIHEYTGLSENSIKMLHFWNKHFPDLIAVLSAIIENSRFSGPLLSVISNYRNARGKEKALGKNIIVIDTGDYSPPDSKVWLFTATDKFTRCMENTFKQGQLLS